MSILTGFVGTDISLNIIEKLFSDKNEIIINSNGGDLYQGLAIYDYLKLNNIDTIGVNGVCASAATIILCSAKNRWATENSRFLIHNPMSGNVGDANAMQKTADELLKEENILIDFYVKILNKDFQFIQNLMKQEKFLTSQEALELGLINQIKTTNNLINNKMEEKNILNKIYNFIIKKSPLNLIKQDISGVELEFSELNNESEIRVGAKVNIDGKPAEGNYIMPSGETFVCVGGVLTEIIMPLEDNAEIKKLNSEIKDLKVENEKIKNELLEKNILINEIKSQVLAYKNIVSNSKVTPNIGVSTSEETKNKHSFKIPVLNGIKR